MSNPRTTKFIKTDHGDDWGHLAYFSKEEPRSLKEMYDRLLDDYHEKDVDPPRYETVGLSVLESLEKGFLGTMAVMPEIGVKCPLTFEHVRDIEYWEGPLISVLKGSDDNTYLAVWRECDYYHHRFLVVRCAPEDIDLYEQGEITLQALAEKHTSYYLVDVDDGIKRVYQVFKMELYEGLMLGDSYYDPELAPCTVR